MGDFYSKINKKFSLSDYWNLSHLDPDNHHREDEAVQTFFYYSLNIELMKPSWESHQCQGRLYHFEDWSTRLCHPSK